MKRLFFLTTLLFTLLSGFFLTEPHSARARWSSSLNGLGLTQ